MPPPPVAPPASAPRAFVRTISPRKKFSTWSLATWAGLIVLGIAIKLGVSTSVANYKLNQQERSLAASGGIGSASQLHTYRSGDRWTYNVVGSIRGANGLSVGGAGTITEAISSTTFNGQSCLADTTLFDVTFSNGFSTLPLKTQETIYFTQDAQGDYQELGDDAGPNHSIRTLQRPTVIQPGVWAGRAAIDTPLNFTDGRTGRIRQSVVATPSMEPTTTGQRVMCWPVRLDETDPESGATSIQSLFSPELGEPIQQDVSVPVAGGMVVTLKGTLVSAHLQ